MHLARNLVWPESALSLRAQPVGWVRVERALQRAMTAARREVFQVRFHTANPPIQNTEFSAVNISHAWFIELLLNKARRRLPGGYEYSGWLRAGAQRPRGPGVAPGKAPAIHIGMSQSIQLPF